MAFLIQKKMIALILCLSMAAIVTITPRPVNAGYWGEPTYAEYMGVMMKEMLQNFKDAMVANLKTMASKMLQQRLMALLGGGGGGKSGGKGGGKGGEGSMIITNYEKFIFDSSNQKTEVFIDNFFSSLSSGAGADTKKMLEGTKKGVKQEVVNPAGTPRTTIDKYVNGGMKNVLNIKQGGSYKAYVEALDNPYNNPFGAFLMGSRAGDDKKTKEVESKKVMATAGQGFVGKIDPKTNIIKTPGSIIKDLTAFVEDLPNRILAAARSIPEVVTTLAAQFLTSAIEKGLNQVLEPLDQQIANINEQMAKFGVTPGDIINGAGDLLKTGSDGNINSSNKMQGSIYSGTKWVSEGDDWTINYKNDDEWGIVYMQ